MKTISKILMTLSIMLGFMVLFAGTAYGYTADDINSLEQQLEVIDEKQSTAIEMAESARKLGYKENSQVIIEAKQIWETAENEKRALVGVIDTLKKQKEVDDEKDRIQKEIEEERQRQIENSRKKLVYDAHTPSNLSVDDFNYLLKNTNLAGTGSSFHYIEKNNKVNGLFAIAVATQESSAGKYNANKNNFWGRRASRGGWMSWNSPDASIKSFGEYISGKLYRGKSIEQIAKIYCPPTHADWANKIKLHMNNYWSRLDY